MTTPQDVMEKRLEKAKNAPAKPSKAERLAGVVARSFEEKSPPKVKKKEIRVTEIGDKPKTTKKPSQTVKEWKALNKEKKDWPDEKMKIHIITKDEKPKRGKALDRFKLYRNGMTVIQYVEECKKIGVAKGAAIQDVKWDYVKKFIDVK